MIDGKTVQTVDSTHSPVRFRVELKSLPPDCVAWFKDTLTTKPTEMTDKEYDLWDERFSYTQDPSPGFADWRGDTKDWPRVGYEITDDAVELYANDDSDVDCAVAILQAYIRETLERDVISFEFKSIDDCSHCAVVISVGHYESLSVRDWVRDTEERLLEMADVETATRVYEDLMNATRGFTKLATLFAVSELISAIGEQSVVEWTRCEEVTELCTRLSRNLGFEHPIWNYITIVDS